MVIVDSLQKIEKELGLNDDGPIQNFMVATCQRYMDPYVPMDKGFLRTIIYMDSHSITYMSPYASYQYYGVRKDGTHKINPENYTTAGTGPYWDQRMLSADGKKVIKEIEDLMKRGA